MATDAPTLPAELGLLHERDRLLKDIRQLTRSNFMRGSLSLVGRTCGKPRCACVTEGRKHKARYVSVKLQGKTRLAYVSAEQEEEVLRALRVHARVAKLIDELTVVNLELLKQSRRARGRAAKKP